MAASTVLKSAARHAIALARRAGGGLARAERGNRGHLLILCYHRVLPAPRKAAYFLPGLAVTPEGFRAHCALLRAHYDVLPLAEAHARWRAGEAACGGRPLAAITFDDGYRDNARYAQPILDALGLRATFFVVAGLAGTGEAPWYDRLARASGALARIGAPGVPHAAGPAALVEWAKALPPEAREGLTAAAVEAAGGDRLEPALDAIMGADELRALAAAGHEIGSHSLTHPILTQLAPAALERELRESRAVLGAVCGAMPISFCYPNGDYNDAVCAAAAAAGYALAVTTAQGVNAPGAPPMALARVFMHEDRLARPWGGASSSLARWEWTPARHARAAKDSP